MAASVINIKSQPPILDDGISYEIWKKEIELWQKLTDLEVEKQSIAFQFSLR